MCSLKMTPHSSRVRSCVEFCTLVCFPRVQIVEVWVKPVYLTLGFEKERRWETMSRVSRFELPVRTGFHWGYFCDRWSQKLRLFAKRVMEFLCFFFCRKTTWIGEIARNCLWHVMSVGKRDLLAVLTFDVRESKACRKCRKNSKRLQIPSSTAPSEIQAGRRDSPLWKSRPISERTNYTFS